MNKPHIPVYAYIIMKAVIAGKVILPLAQKDLE